jgi:uncharacterized protein (UPF0332 family)
MDFREFLTLAVALAGGSSEGSWRSAVSRGYYAAFHVALDLLRDLGFAVPQGDQAHAFAWLRLSNSAHPDVILAGQKLNRLRTQRNRADYDRLPPVLQAEANSCTQRAEEVILALDAARLEPTRTQIVTAMCAYERNVLRTVTWRPTP